MREAKITVNTNKVQSKINGVSCYFADLTQGWFSILSSVSLMKPDVFCPAKRQLKLEKETSLRISTERTTE